MPFMSELDLDCDLLQPSTFHNLGVLSNSLAAESLGSGFRTSLSCPIHYQGLCQPGRRHTYRKAELFLGQLSTEQKRDIQKGEASLEPSLGETAWVRNGSGHRQ